ncbi:MAG: methyltransferase domain-containing protein [Candidatus Delongbacteria bacterium]|jgi:ubiquinone/menaquinone biosynthesis C-methylase UbiE|nr:methyltransferase domain-containing protein [Candidatus Delongbacteria bacterium]
MSLESKKIKSIYSGKVAERYDFSLPPFFAHWKKKAFNESSLKKGNHVLVFCCGTGLDFTHILQKIGSEGKIIGVDFSSEMLKAAKEKIEKEKWENIELIESDITKYEDKLGEKYDVGVCTLGLSIIPEYKLAYNNLLSNVKENGEIIIGDMQLASGWLACFNPLTIYLAKKFGGTHEGHQNSKEIYSMMKKGLTGVKKEEFFFKSYYYCIGQKIKEK